jgi:hypothetical protein
VLFRGCYPQVCFSLSGPFLRSPCRVPNGGLLVGSPVGAMKGVPCRGPHQGITCVGHMESVVGGCPLENIPWRVSPEGDPLDEKR